MGIVEAFQKVRKLRLEDINTFKLNKRIEAYYWFVLGCVMIVFAFLLGVLFLDAFATAIFLFVAVFLFMMYVTDMHQIKYHLFDMFTKARKRAGLIDERNWDVEPAIYVEKGA